MRVPPPMKPCTSRATRVESRENTPAHLPQEQVWSSLCPHRPRTALDLHRPGRVSTAPQDVGRPDWRSEWGIEPRVGSRTRSTPDARGGCESGVATKFEHFCSITPHGGQILPKAAWCFTTRRDSHDRNRIWRTPREGARRGNHRDRVDRRNVEPGHGLSQSLARM